MTSSRFSSDSYAFFLDALASCIADLDRVRGHVSAEAFLNRLAGRIDHAIVREGPEYSDAKGVSDIHSLLRAAVLVYQQVNPPETS